MIWALGIVWSSIAVILVWRGIGFLRLTIEDRRTHTGRPADG